MENNPPPPDFELSKLIDAENKVKFLMKKLDVIHTQLYEIIFAVEKCHEDKRVSPNSVDVHQHIVVVKTLHALIRRIRKLHDHAVQCSWQAKSKARHTHWRMNTQHEEESGIQHVFWPHPWRI